MTKPTITVITPTFGRSTILDCIANVVPQLREGDEYIIVGDGPVKLGELIRSFPQVRYMETPVHAGDFGCTPWDYGIERAEGDYIMFLGDDNLLSLNALELVRAGVQQRRPELPHLFAMMHTGKVLADSRACGRVDNQQFVIPNVEGLPRMKDCPPEDILISDWHFIDRTIKHFGGVVYHPDIIAILKQQNFGAML